MLPKLDNLHCSQFDGGIAAIHKAKRVNSLVESLAHCLKVFRLKGVMAQAEPPPRQHAATAIERAG